MPTADLYQTLARFNTHWTTGKPSPLVRRHPLARRSFRHIRNRIEDLPFEILAGPRQVGKTTLVGHLIDHLLANGIPPERILFVPCDHPAIALELKGHLQPVIELLQDRIIRTRLEDLDGPVFLLLDEVHDLSDWSRELKGLYDAYHPWLRVFATGSSSTALLNPPGADLAGRARTSRIHPLKFSEAVQLRSPGLQQDDHNLFELARAARGAFSDPATPQGKKRLRRTLDDLHGALATQTGALGPLFDHYLVRGGYPLGLTADTDTDALLFHEQTIDLILARDLSHHPRVRKPNAFRAFLAQLARQHGGKFHSKNVAENIGVDKETPAHWKEIAEHLFLVQQLPALNHRFRPLPRKADKAYLLDPGLRSYLSSERTLEDLEANGRIGAVVEGVVQDHTRRLQFNLFHRLHNRIGYLPRPEIDLVAEVPKGWLAIEVKYTQRPEQAMRALERITLPHPDVLRILLTRNRYDTSGNVWCLPASMYCMIC